MSLGVPALRLTKVLNTNNKNTKRIIFKKVLKSNPLNSIFLVCGSTGHVLATAAPHTETKDCEGFDARLIFL